MHKESVNGVFFIPEIITVSLAQQVAYLLRRVTCLVIKDPDAVKEKACSLAF